jgi:hypothetical protein
LEKPVMVQLYVLKREVAEARKQMQGHAATCSVCHMNGACADYDYYADRWKRLIGEYERKLDGKPRGMNIRIS